MSFFFAQRAHILAFGLRLVDSMLLLASERVVARGFASFAGILTH